MVSSKFLLDSNWFQSIFNSRVFVVAVIVVVLHCFPAPLVRGQPAVAMGFLDVVLLQDLI